MNRQYDQKYESNIKMNITPLMSGHSKYFYKLAASRWRTYRIKTPVETTKIKLINAAISTRVIRFDFFIIFKSTIEMSALGR